MQFETPEFKRVHAACENSALQYNTVPAIDSSFERSQREVIRANFNFPIPLSENLFTRFAISSSHLMIDALTMGLHVVARLIHKDGTNLEEHENAAVSPALLTTMIAKMEISSNGKKVVTYNYYPYVSFTQQLLHFEKGYIDDTLSSMQMFYPDHHIGDDFFMDWF